MGKRESHVPAKRQVAFEVVGANPLKVRSSMIMCGVVFEVTHPEGEPDKAIFNPSVKLSEKDITDTKTCLQKYFGGENVTPVSPMSTPRACSYVSSLSVNKQIDNTKFVRRGLTQTQQ